ncbi:MAG: FAD-dependent oxidoreductase [Polyangiales bacterium]
MPAAPPALPSSRFLIVGAGVAGLMAASALRDAGQSVTLVDKGRAAGGRLATRRVDGAVFDHGAQFFTARDPRLAPQLARWRAAGAVTSWFDEVLRGAQGMSSLSRHLAAGLSLTLGARVASVARDDAGWRVTTDAGAAWRGDTVILTAPAPQSLALVDAGGVALPAALRADLDSLAYAPCLAGLFEGAWPDPLPAHGVAPVVTEPLSWLASNAAKGISDRPALTAHASAGWSQARWGDDDDAILSALGAAVEAVTGASARPVALKRWRYARPTRTLPAPLSHRDGGARLIFTGDAFDDDGGRVEGAARAGLAAAAIALRPRG